MHTCIHTHISSYKCKKKEEEEEIKNKRTFETSRNRYFVKKSCIKLHILPVITYMC